MSVIIVDSDGKANVFKPRTLIHEMARLFRKVMEGCQITASHLNREEWSALRGVSRLECKKVLLSLFGIPFQPRFLVQEHISLSLKMVGVESGRSSWRHKAEWLALRTIARCESVVIEYVGGINDSF